MLDNNQRALRKDPIVGAEINSESHKDAPCFPCSLHRSKVKHPTIKLVGFLALFKLPQLGDQEKKVNKHGLMHWAKEGSLKPADSAR
eukprot:1147862-Pelagomonas_calceolata.AAC.1